MRARAVTLRPFPVTEMVKCRAKRRSLAVATRWWLLKALIRQLNSAEQARVTRLQPSAPPPWPPRPTFLAHFLHPPGGSLHYSVPESDLVSPAAAPYAVVPAPVQRRREGAEGALPQTRQAGCQLMREFRPSLLLEVGT